MINNINKLQYLLKRYAENTCSKEEMEELFQMIAASESNRQFNEQLLHIWNGINASQKGILTSEDDVFSQIREKIHHINKRKYRVNWFLAAAVVSGIALTGLFIYLNPAERKEIAQKNITNTDTSSRHEHKLLALPDGSTVLLNENSNLDFPLQFSGSTREVVLVGEAYFEIKKDASRPFIIHTGKVKTKVLGTAFNIRAYPDELDVTVTVTKGKVRVEMENKTLGILTPNQQISYNKKSNAALQMEVISDSVLVWKGKDLVFDNITFEEAAVMISERYDMKIVFANENIKKCRFNASFLYDNKVQQVMTVLCDLNNASYTINEKQIFINGEGCE